MYDRWRVQREVLGGQGGFWWWREEVVLEEDPTMGLEDVWENWRALCQIVTLWSWMDSSEILLITYCLYKREWESCRLWWRYWQALTTSDWFVCVKTDYNWDFCFPCGFVATETLVSEFHVYYCFMSSRFRSVLWSWCQRWISITGLLQSLLLII